MGKNSGVSMFSIVLFGTAVFAMHFGASCMLWPVTWGQQSGSSLFEASLGLLLTAIIFPFFAYLAIVRGEGSFYLLASRIGEKFAFVFGGITVLVLGPLFVIPRMSAASWDAICKIGNWNSEQMLAALIFAVIYYLLTYWFMFKLDEVLSKIGKYLVPFLGVMLIAVVTKSLLNPLSSWMSKMYSQTAFSYGFINGYQTMDLPAALIFGTIIIANLKTFNLKKQELCNKLLIVGGVGFSILAFSHLAQMMVGASTGYVFSDVSYAKLYATIILQLWGVVGGTLFNFVLLLAALTSAVGLSAGTAAYFEEASKKKWSYRAVAITILMISAFISSFGLSTIITFTAPLLSLIYPPCIALVIGYIISGTKRIALVAGATIVGFCWGFLDCILGYLSIFKVDTTEFLNIYNLIPGAKIGMGWVIPTIIGGIVGLILTNAIKKDEIDSSADI